MTTIALISDSVDFLNKIESNLSLFRKDDVFLKYRIVGCTSVRSDVEIVLMYSDDKDAITPEFVKQIKNENNYLILFLPAYEDDVLLKMYDSGVNDFCLKDSLTSELIIKIVNGQKFLSEKKLSTSYKDILIAGNILKENNAVYKSLDTVLNPRLAKTCLKAAFLAIDVPPESRQKFIDDNLEARLVTALRTSDIIVNYKDFCYLLILTDTAFEKVKNVYEKLTNALEIKLTGMLIRYKSIIPAEIMDKIDCLRMYAQTECKFFVEEEEQTSQDIEKDWLDDSIALDEPKNYKFFRAMYRAKVDKVIRPVFFRMKEKYDDISSGLRIKFSNNENLSEFLMFYGEKVNSFKILFENSMDLKFNLNFGGLYAPENIEFTLPFAQVSTKQLTDIVQKFVEEGVKNEVDK
ncbi:hypothetical protein J6S88_06275 [bacterium]|nr:hypothetical protein [bacterium]